jgi:RNA polymerase sigma factor (sigma-70 family)
VVKAQCGPAAIYSSQVSDYHVTDDLLQETFVRIHRALPSLNNKDRLAAWVHQIARNSIRDRYRRTSASEQLSVDNVAEGSRSTWHFSFRGCGHAGRPEETPSASAGPRLAPR